MVVEFLIQNVTYVNAGVYCCVHGKQRVWSEVRDTLDLVVTGVYTKAPSLTAHPGANVTSRETVTLLCHVHNYDIFLCKNGTAVCPQDYLYQDHNTFLISPVTSAHQGTYRCYGCFSNNQSRWSLPSDPLELLVTESLPRDYGKENIPDYTTENIIQFSLGGLLLLVMGLLLLGARKGREGLSSLLSSRSLDIPWHPSFSGPHSSYPHQPG
ncbi:leukocyte immunoglobulin-like receptor subfamily B member 4 [Prionailurus iriomotensis]